MNFNQYYLYILKEQKEQFLYKIVNLHKKQATYNTIASHHRWCRTLVSDSAAGAIIEETLSIYGRYKSMEDIIRRDVGFMKIIYVNKYLAFTYVLNDSIKIIVRADAPYYDLVNSDLTYNTKLIQAVFDDPAKFGELLIAFNKLNSLNDNKDSLFDNNFMNELT